MAHHHHEVKASNLDPRLWTSAILNLAITLIEVIGGLWAGSLALLADSAHNLMDVAALGLAILSRRVGSPVQRGGADRDFRLDRA
jgi:cobalt-zinc-cadmium efflux system protein